MRIFYISVISALVLVSSCTTIVVSKPVPKSSKQTAVKTNPNGKVPPGQMKKTTGSQSAKPYAPGQQKKTTGTQTATQTAPGQQKKKK